MQLGELELVVLKAVRELGQASSGEIFRRVRKDRNVAYTSVTTTLYRLVDKGLVAARRKSKRKVSYFAIESGEAYDEAVRGSIERLVAAFGPSAVSYALRGTESLSAHEAGELREAIEARRLREKKHGER